MIDGDSSASPAATTRTACSALAEAMAAIAELIEVHSLQGRNDAPARTQREVVAVLERARLPVLGG